MRGSLGRGQGLGLGLNNRVPIVVGRLIGKVTTNQIANLAGYHLVLQKVTFVMIGCVLTFAGCLHALL